MFLHLPLAIVAIHLAAAPGIPSRIVREAQQEAARVLASAHIQLIWVDAPGLQMEITGNELQGVARDAVGLAALSQEGSRATISWPEVRRAAAETDTDPEVVLAAAMAHEIGHLLFGPSHRPTGIMSRHFGRKEMLLAMRGELLF